MTFAVGSSLIDTAVGFFSFFQQSGSFLSASACRHVSVSHLRADWSHLTPVSLPLIKPPVESPVSSDGVPHVCRSHILGGTIPAHRIPAWQSTGPVVRGLKRPVPILSGSLHAVL